MARTRRLRVVGARRLAGTVWISGAKNSAVAILPATLLADEPSFLHNIPDIRDVATMLEILETLGARCSRQGGQVTVRPGDSLSPEVPYGPAKRMRASCLLLGPLLARLGQAVVPLPGGCDIGSRPLDLHLKGLAALGAEVAIERGAVVARARRLRGAEIYLDFPSVGATENLMMAATRAQGLTVLHNAAKEPEVVDLANFLNGMGARVRGAGTDLVRIQGVPALHGTSHSVIPDRIEAGTYLLAALATGGEVAVEGVIAKHIEPVLAKLEECGASLWVEADRVFARLATRPRAIQLRTMPYPGFPTDLQPQFTAFLMRGLGTSVITEKVFENRFGHVDELRRLGGRLATDGQMAVVDGVERLTGAPLTATDLRMGAALLIGALAAEGESVIEGAEYLLRGYEAIDEKLAPLGAAVEWLED